jgi:dTDP-4-dehydrorhamnose reductase
VSAPAQARVKALVFGARGMLGSELVRSAPAGVEVVPIPRERCDVSLREAVRTLVRAEAPALLLNATAYTAVDRAEEEPLAAYRANGTGPLNLALAAKECAARLVHVGTDFVFDGARLPRRPYEEFDAANPRSVYGSSKHWGEQAVLETGGDAQVVRTQWLYGPRGKHFVGAILKAATERPFLTVVEDQIGCPTYTVDLARALWRIALEGEPGLWHCANAGEASWHAFASRALALTGSRIEVRPITTAELARPAARPAYSALACRRAELSLGLRLRSWQDALAEYLADPAEVERLRSGAPATEVPSETSRAREARPH